MCSTSSSRFGTEGSIHSWVSDPVRFRAGDSVRERAADRDSAAGTGLPGVPIVIVPVLLGALMLIAGCAGGESAETVGGWSSYQGGPHSNQYSGLTQIDTANVEALEVAWTYETGDARQDPPSTIECNPIVVDGTLYGTSPRLKVFAIDAATGEQRWIYDPFDGERASGVNRGVMHWSGEEGARILFTAEEYLYALDAETGRLIRSFGDSGRVDLTDGLDRDIGDRSVSYTSPGRVYEDLVILGSSVGEGPRPAAPGHIRAYDVRTGEQEWIFHTIPFPDEYGHETWPRGAHLEKGGANNWTGMSLDPERGVVYVPTGSGSFDFYGGDRPGTNLFSTSILALDARTGERIWHYQTVHHNIWDYDIPAPPNLIEVRHDGEMVEALAQITKTGHVFLLDRETGVPLFPVQERPVPASDLIGEEAWPTQPVPVKPPPFARQAYTRELIPDYSEGARSEVLDRFDEVRPGSLFVPPSTDGTVIFPGFNGGGEWGGASYDPATGWLYVNAQELPWILTMVPTEGEEGGATATTIGELLYRSNCASCHGLDRSGAPPTYPSLVDVADRRGEATIRAVIENGQGRMPSFGHLSDREVEALLAYLSGESSGEAVAADSASAPIPHPYTHTGYNKWKTSNGYPAVDPPWGTLSAIDLTSGEIVWQVPHGEHAELLDRGMPPTGTENFGGPVATGGGLVFIAGTKDEKIRAYHKRTGEVLWEASLPAGGYATPSVYETGGRQYVVIAAGGGGKIGTKAGDAYVAFALPESASSESP